MEPGSFLGFIVVLMATGAVLSIVTKRTKVSCGKTPQTDPSQSPTVVSKNTGDKPAEIVDAEKEKEIDELIAQRIVKKPAERGER